MKITVNDKVQELDDTTTLTQLLSYMNIPDAGTAVALNQSVVPRSGWLTHQLSDGDNVMIIRATAGG